MNTYQNWKSVLSVCSFGDGFQFFSARRPIESVAGPDVSLAGLSALVEHGWESPHFGLLLSLGTPFISDRPRNKQGAEAAMPREILAIELQDDSSLLTRWRAHWRTNT
jgi:hypothetical protein